MSKIHQPRQRLFIETLRMLQNGAGELIAALELDLNPTPKDENDAASQIDTNPATVISESLDRFDDLLPIVKDVRNAFLREYSLVDTADMTIGFTEQGDE